MAGCQVRIEHIGSTAVPGLCGKPVLDILLGVAVLSEVERVVARFAANGYRYRPEYEKQIPQRRYFVKDAEGRHQRVHLHAVHVDGPIWQQHLAFRDALRDCPGLASEYALLKRRLAVSMSKSSYTEAKAPFIRQVLARTAFLDK
jgi:GrpB-like predicted nucleotidyltransferase (UPF0157 family)